MAMARREDGLVAQGDHEDGSSVIAWFFTIPMSLCPQRFALAWLAALISGIAVPIRMKVLVHLPDAQQTDLISNRDRPCL